MALTALLLQQLLFAWTGLHFESMAFWLAIGLGGLLIWLAGMMRRSGNQNVSALIETLVLLSITGITGALLQYPMVVLSSPLADATLLKWDQFLGFDWTQFARLFADPKADLVLFVVYDLFRLEGGYILGFLCLSGQINKAWQLLTAASACLLVSVSMLPWFAADGSFVGCGLRVEGLPFHSNLCTYGPIIDGLKDGAIRTIDGSMYYGLVSFPSFHVAGALLLVWAVWHWRIGRWLSLIFNVLMGIAAIVIGGHYFVDIVGGLILGLASILLVKRLIPDAASASPQRTGAAMQRSR